MTLQLDFSNVQRRSEPVVLETVRRSSEWLAAALDDRGRAGLSFDTRAHLQALDNGAVEAYLGQFLPGDADAMGQLEPDVKYWPSTCVGFSDEKNGWVLRRVVEESRAIDNGVFVDTRIHVREPTAASDETPRLGAGPGRRAITTYAAVGFRNRPELHELRRRAARAAHPRSARGLSLARPEGKAAHRRTGFGQDVPAVDEADIMAHGRPEGAGRNPRRNRRGWAARNRPHYFGGSGSDHPRARQTPATSHRLPHNGCRDRHSFQGGGFSEFRRHLVERPWAGGVLCLHPRAESACPLRRFCGSPGRFRDGAVARLGAPSAVFDGLEG